MSFATKLFVIWRYIYTISYRAQTRQCLESWGPWITSNQEAMHMLEWHMAFHCFLILFVEQEPWSINKVDSSSCRSSQEPNDRWSEGTRGGLIGGTLSVLYLWDQHIPYRRVPIYYVGLLYIILSWYITVWRAKMRVAVLDVRTDRQRSVSTGHPFRLHPNFSDCCTTPPTSPNRREYTQQWSIDDGWKRQQRYLLLNLLFQAVQQRPKEGFESS